MAINAEWIFNKAKQRIYAVSHAKAVVRGTSTVDSDLAKLENEVKDINNSIENLGSSEDILAIKGDIEGINNTLNNVEVTGANEGDALVWDSTQSKFVPNSVSKEFVGTMNEWNALSSTEKSKYNGKIVNITDDYS